MDGAFGESPRRPLAANFFETFRGHSPGRPLSVRAGVCGGALGKSLFREGQPREPPGQLPGLEVAPPLNPPLESNEILAHDSVDVSLKDEAEMEFGAIVVWRGGWFENGGLKWGNAKQLKLWSRAESQRKVLGSCNFCQC